MNTDGTGLAAVCAPGTLGDGAHQLALDPVLSQIYFTRAVSYDNHEVSRVNYGAGCTGLTVSFLAGGNTGPGWFPSGLAHDPVADILYWGDSGVLNLPPHGSVNQMTASTLAVGPLPTQLTPHVNGRGRGMALHQASGTIFLTAHDQGGPFGGGGGPGTGGAIFAYDIVLDTETQIIPASGFDAGTGYWDIEIGPSGQRIWYTAYGAGEIRSAKFDGTDVQVELSGLTNPYGLAVEDDFVAAVEPDGDNPVEVFSGEVGDPDGNPFIGFTYPKVSPGGDGVVTTLCCKFEDRRETLGSGGRRLFYEPGDMDIGMELQAAVDTNFDPNCADLVPFVPIGAAIARPWQRINPNPLFSRDYDDPAYVALLEGAFCVVESTVGSVGPAVTEEDPFPLVNYSSDCDTDPAEFRPVTGTISILPVDQNNPFLQTATMECDGGRSGRRSSITGYWINMRNDITQNSRFALINRHYSDMRDEIVPLIGGCVDVGEDRTGPLLNQWQLGKRSLNKNKKKPDKILSQTIVILEDLTRLALACILHE